MSPRKPSDAVELAAATLEQASRLLAETARSMRQRAIERGDLAPDEPAAPDEDEEDTDPENPGPKVA
jgi:hypothetical protein